MLTCFLFEQYAQRERGVEHGIDAQICGFR